MTNARVDRTETDARFATGFRVTLDPSVELCPDGRHLLAGSPTRVLSLGADALAYLRSLYATGSLAVTASDRQMVERLLALDVLQPLPADQLRGAESVTVVIPVRDQPHHVEALLRCEAAFRGVTAVIVVDDGSRDSQTLRKIAANATSVTVEVARSEVSMGPAGARNLGASLTTTPLVVFVDADCRPHARWLDPLLAHFDDHAVAMVAPRIRAVRPTDEGAPSRHGVRRAFFEQLLAYELERGPLDLGDGPSAVGPDRPRNHVPSAALAVRRSAFEAVEGFDPSLRFGEDTDLVWRLSDAGWVVRYEPSSEVQHEIRASLDAVVRQRFEYGSGAVDVAARYPGRFTLLSIEPAHLTALALAGAGLTFPAAAAAASTVLPALRWNDFGVPLERTARRRAKDQLGEAARLAWLLRQGLWPLVLALSLVSRRFRRLALVAFLAPPVIDWRRRRGRLSLFGSLTFSVIDALAGGAGVWAGCLRRRDFRVLSPRWIRGSLKEE